MLLEWESEKGRYKICSTESVKTVIFWCLCL